ncbi:MAG: hypothetical protein IPP74_02955 [Alphaproteobacteria bacterium]|nr:hypothetical protein [Alphaproteobacteria bacterium]
MRNNSKRLLMLLSMGVALAPLTTAASAQEVRYFQGENTSSLTMMMSQKVAISSVNRGQDLMVHFSAPVSLPVVSQERLTQMGIVLFQPGDDTLLITTEKGVKASIIQQGNKLVLHTQRVVSRNAKQAVIRNNAANTGQVNLGIAKARLLSLQGNYKESQAQLNNLNYQYPNNTDVLIAKADNAQKLGDWQQALTYLDYAHQLQPQNEYITDVRNSTLLDKRSVVDGGIYVESEGKVATERVQWMHGQAQINPTTAMGLLVERNGFTGAPIRNALTGALQERSANVYRNDLYLLHEFTPQQTGKASLYTGSGGIVGGGAQYTFKDIRGETTLSADYHRPTWDFLEAVTQRGTKDNVMISRTQHFTPQLTGYLATGLNRYGIAGDSNVATSLSVDGSLRYQLPPYSKVVQVLGKGGRMSVGYIFDGEYPFSRERRLDAGLVPYYPLSVFARETHTVDINVGKQINQKWDVEGFIGYSVDRYQTGAPTFGGRIAYKPTRNTELALEASRHMGTDAAKEKVDRIGISFKILFDTPSAKPQAEIDRQRNVAAMKKGTYQVEEQKTGFRFGDSSMVKANNPACHSDTSLLCVE